MKFKVKLDSGLNHTLIAECLQIQIITHTHWRHCKTWSPSKFGIWSPALSHISMIYSPPPPKEIKSESKPIFLADDTNAII
jgi:hypothetical protein